jgi:leader peptidase (prepilin peptidase) / N-methyltransferase
MFNLADQIQKMGTGWQAYLGFLVFCFGACWGSFLNVCIYRIPLDQSVVTPRSHCPQCGQMIAWYDNIPLLSFCLLRARCRRCAQPISPRYVLVELLVAALFVLVWLKLGPAGAVRPLGLAPVAEFRLVLIYWLAVFGLVLGTFVDFEHMIIPDRVSLGGIVAGLVLSAAAPALHGAATWLGGLGSAAIGAVVGSGLLWVVALLGKLAFRKDAMGMGDVKLLGAIGAFLGWGAVLFTLMVSSFAGSIVGLVLVASKRKEMQGRIPYGPYLALAALIWLLWGPTLWNAYVNWLTPPLT